MLFTSPHPKKYSNIKTDLPTFSKNELNNNKSNSDKTTNLLEVEDSLKKSIKESNTGISIQGIN